MADKREVEGLAARASSVIEAAPAAAVEAASRAGEAGRQAWNIGQKLGRRAREQAQEATSQFSEHAESSLRSARGQIRANPIVSVLVGGALGYLLALMTSRRS